MEVHEDRLTGKEKGLTTFILLPSSLLLTAPPSSLRGDGLNFFGFAEKFNTPLSSLVARRPGLGPFGETSEEGEERASGSPVSVPSHIIQLRGETSSTSPSKTK